MYRLLKTMFLVSIAIFSSSCAMLFSDGVYPVMITSEPSNAAISITNNKGRRVFDGFTPAQVSLKSSIGFFKKADYLVQINLDGYRERNVAINATIDPWYWANFLLGPYAMFGLFVFDPITGEMYKLKTEKIHETLYSH